MENKVLKEQLTEYISWMEKGERSTATRKQYERDISRFLSFLGQNDLSKEIILQYKHKLEMEYQPSSVNAKIAALNGFCAFIGRDDIHLKAVKIQSKAYCSADQELTKTEYLKLVKTANNRDQKVSLILQTICGTGIRVSELKYITVEAVAAGEAVIKLKGKTRIILLPAKLCKNLKNYIQKEKISSGSVFVTKNGNPLDRSNIWRMMKRLCKEAGVDEKKVFPHNLRHLFARTFYELDKDIAKLADVLGHSNINTTRIYIITSGREHRRKLDALQLVV